MKDPAQRPLSLIEQALSGHRRRWLAGGGLIVLTLLASIGLLSLAGWFITATGLAGLGLFLLLDIYTPGAGIRALTLVRTVARYGERLLNHDTTLRVLADLRVATFERFMPLPARRLDACRSGDVLNRLTADIDALDHVLLRVVGPTLAASVLVVAAGGVLALIDLVLAAAVTGVLCAGMAIVAWLAVRLGRPLNRALTASLAELRIRVVEATQGLAELQVFGALAAYRQQLDSASARHLSLQQQAGRLTAAIQTAASLIGHLSVWVALIMGLALLDAERISAPVLVLLVFGVLALTEGWLPLPQAWQHFERSREAARRILELTQPAAGSGGVDHAGTVPNAGSLTLDAVTFRYLAQADAVLKDFSLRIPAGRRIALCGASGSGKSTVARLLVGLEQPLSGAVRLDGMDLRTLPANGIHGVIGYLTQQPVLFSDTLAANLRLARPDASDTQLDDALDIACLSEFVERLPEGLDTWIGEMGINLSGGEARRLALARVILKNAPVVILDEPGAGLDQATLQKLSVNLERWLRGRTTLLITHQPSQWPWVDDQATLPATTRPARGSSEKPRG